MDYQEYSKISIHNHLGGKDSERTLNDPYDKKLDFDFNIAKTVIDDAATNKFNLLALTNSNVFSVSNYLMVKLYAKEKGIEILPGTEINLANVSRKKFLHVVIIVDPKSNLINFEKTINNKMKKNKNNYLTLNQLVELIIKYKVVLIPHGLKQSNEKKANKDRSAAGNSEQFKEIISMDDAIPIVLEDSKKYHKETLKIKLKNELNSNENYWLDRSTSVSSADRSSFDKIESPTYIWGNNTFDDLYFSAIMKGSRIKRDEDIIKKTSYISRIEIIPKVENPQIEKCVIECSHGLNSIIGKSGSGKTLLLNAIKYNLIGEHLTCRTSGISEYKNIYNDVNFVLYDANGAPIDNSSGWKVFEGENLYNKILQVYSSDKSKIIEELHLEINDLKFKDKMRDFSKELTTYCRNSIKISKLKIQLDKYCATFSSNIIFLKENKKNNSNSITYLIDSKLESNNNRLLNSMRKILSDLEKYNQNYQSIQEIINTYGDNKLKEEFNILNEKIIISIRLKLKEITSYMLSYRKSLLVKRTLFDIAKKYNSIMGKKIEVIMDKQQDNLRLIEQIKKTLESIIFLKETLKIPTLNKNEFDEILFLEKNNISKLTVKKINLCFDYSQLTDIFESCVGSSKNKINLSEFKNVTLNLSDANSMRKFLNVFVDKDYDYDIEISYDYRYYVDYELQLKNSNKNFENIETMSAGELSKTYINNLLDKQISNGASNLIVLFDQPDNSLEKKFILNELVSKVNELRNHYQVFITTHEPLLVVNADSNKIIEAQNNKSAVSSKNKIKYSNLTFVDSINSKEAMVEKIAELVDGSYEAIKTRDKIYGGMLNENNNR